MPKTHDKILKFAQKNHIELFKSKKNHFIMKEGSTFVYILVKEESEEEWVVFYSLVVKGAKTTNSGRLSDVRGDENAIVFFWKDASDFQKIKDTIEDKISSIRDGGAISTSSNLDELEKLASLHDKGVVTDEEFEAKKKELLKL